MAFWSAKDVHHEAAVRLVGQLQAGNLGKGFLTDYVFAETMNYLTVKSRNRATPERVARDLLGEDKEPWLQLLFVDELTWRDARTRFGALSRAGLSFTDCTSIAVVERLGFKGIIGFDAGFDGIIARFSA